MASAKGKGSKAKAATQDGRDIILVILDESASMMACYDSTVSGYNEYIRTLRNQDNGRECLVTLTKFNGGSTAPQTTYVEFVNLPVADVPTLGLESYKPNHCTALYDAIGITVHEATKGLQKGDRVVCCIVTDGQENSSRKYSKQQVMDILAEREQAGNWTTTYLSASPSAMHDAQSLGVSAGNTRAYNPTPVGTQSAWAGHANATVSYRAGGQSASKSFYNDAGVDPLKDVQVGDPANPPVFYPAPPVFTPSPTGPVTYQPPRTQPKPSWESKSQTETTQTPSWESQAAPSKPKRAPRKRAVTPA